MFQSAFDVKHGLPDGWVSAEIEINAPDAPGLVQEHLCECGLGATRTPRGVRVGVTPTTVHQLEAAFQTWARTTINGYHLRSVRVASTEEKLERWRDMNATDHEGTIRAPRPALDGTLHLEVA